MRTIAIANQKGGCGKTTSAINIAASLAELGKKVVIIDLDPQGHSTLGLGFSPENMNKTIYDVLTDSRVFISHSVLSTKQNNLYLVPSNILLSGAEFELNGMEGREFTLARQLAATNGNFDICVIDCSPSLSLLTLNALVAGTDVIIPVQVHYYALEGLRQLLETVDIVKERFNQNLKVLGVLLTFVEKRTMLSQQIEQQMRGYFGDLVFNTVIHRTIRLAEAPSAGEPILKYDRSSAAAAEYLALAEEIINGKETIRTA